MSKLLILLILNVSVLLSFSATFSVNANKADTEMEALINEVCEHVVMCMKQEIEKEEGEISPRMLTMIDSMSKMTCQSLSGYSDFVDMSTVTVEDVKGCYNAISTMPCDKLDENDELPACKVIQEKLEQM